MKTTNTVEQKTCLQRAASFDHSSFEWFKVKGEITRLMYLRKLVARDILYAEINQIADNEYVNSLVRKYNRLNNKIKNILNIN